MASKNIAIYLDGTWNNPEDNTNVFQLYERTIGEEFFYNQQPTKISNSIDDIRYYDEGVGNGFFRLLAGITGLGLTNNILQAYKFLCQHYENNDRIYIFGFSRGAFTARSLTGLIDKVGLLAKNEVNEKNLNKAIAIYKNGNSKHNVGRANDGLNKTELQDTENLNSYEQHVTNLKTNTDVRVHFIGVWDTVGALGIPKLAPNFFYNRNKFTMHNTDLCQCVDNAYQALAIDEHRKSFCHTPWTKIHPKNKIVEQRWFVGAHANVGGGMLDNRLNIKPLIWLQKCAISCGLKFYCPIRDDEYWKYEPISDSYKSFAWGVYQLFSPNKHYRKINVSSKQIENHNSENYQENGTLVTEVIDESVWEYLQANENYRPKNLPIQQ